MNTRLIPENQSQNLASAQGVLKQQHLYILSVKAGHKKIQNFAPGAIAVLTAGLCGKMRFAGLIILFNVHGITLET